MNYFVLESTPSEEAIRKLRRRSSALLKAYIGDIGREQASKRLGLLPLGLENFLGRECDDMESLLRSAHALGLEIGLWMEPSQE